MFSALQQGSIIYILEKSNSPILRTGQVVSITQPTFNNSFLATNVDINVKSGDQDMSFKNVPSNQSVFRYDNAVIAETKELMSQEVENMLQNSRNIVNSVTYHNEVIKQCESILKELNPRFAKEQERDEDINNLKNKIGGIESKMDQILSLLADSK